MKNKQGKAGRGVRQTGTPAGEYGQLQQALAHFQAGALPKAELACLQVLKKIPNLAPALHLLGVIEYSSGRAEAAVEHIRRAAALSPGADIYTNLGNALKSLGRLDEAADAFRWVLTMEKETASAHVNLGAVLQAQGKFDEAVASCQRAAVLEPGWAPAHYHLALAFHMAGRLELALESYQRIMLLEPGQTRVLFNIGKTLQALGRMDEAATTYAKVVALGPELDEAHRNLGTVLMDMGRMEEAITSFRQALVARPDNFNANLNLLMALHYATGYSPEAVFAEYQAFAARFEAPLRSGWHPHDNVRDSGRKVRIAYVSGDFREHAVSCFFEPILRQHDRSQFELFCYYNYGVADKTTERIRVLADHWCACSGLSDDELAQRIRDDGIDILMDLSGLSAYNRLLTFARKPAPVQATWVGFPGTTGLTSMDYRFTDAVMDPAGLTDRYHTESLVRLSASFTFSPAPDSPPVKQLPAMATGQITLACLNSVVKINQATVNLWARIMHALPSARMLLGNISTAGVRTRVLEMFERAGIAADRVSLQARMSLTDYLALHNEIDLALDSFPYAGGTTTCHSLWMGVPVITLAGQTSPSRQGAAILAAAGLTELVANTEEDYVNLAVALGKDLPRLNELRQSMRERMAGLASNAGQITVELEAAYRKLWTQWCQA